MEAVLECVKEMQTLKNVKTQRGIGLNGFLKDARNQREKHMTS